MKLKHILDEFGLSEDLHQLPGGSHATYRVGNIVLKQVREACSEQKAAKLIIASFKAKEASRFP
jgi:hypothetical protein